MSRFSWPLRTGQTLIIAAVTLVTLLGIDWGLPSKKRMDLLLAGGAPTPRQIEVLNSLHTLRALGRIASDSLPARRHPGFEIQESIPPWYASTVPGPWLTFTEIERLYALRSYILNSSSADEEYTLVAVGSMNPSRLDFDPKHYLYGGAYLYPVGFMLFAMRSAGLLHVTQDFSYYLHDPSSIARIYLAGRALNLLALIGTLVLLALLGRLLSGEAAGTLALLTYGIATLILDYAVVMKPHVFAAFWAALAVYLLLLYVQRRARAFLVCSALAAGYAAGASAPAALIGVLYPVLLFERGQGRRAVWECLAAWVGMVMVFIATNPYLVVHLKAYLSTVSAAAEAGTTLAVSDPRKLWWFLLGAFGKSYSFPVGLCGLPFLLWCCFRGSGPLRRLAVATVALLVLCGMMSAMVRITIFVAPLVCLFAGLAVAEWIIVPLRTNRLLGAGLATLLFLPAGLNAGLTMRENVCDMTWYEPTARWVRAAGIGPGTTIGLFYLPEPLDLPPFPFLHARLIDMNSAAAGAAPPDYVIVGNYRPVTRRLWEVHPLRPRYRLLQDLAYRPSYDWLRSDKTLNEARIGGFVYELIDRPPASERPAGARANPR